MSRDGGKCEIEEMHGFTPLLQAHWWCEINGSSSFTLVPEIEAGV
jgi:hypothetical protein